MVTPFTRFCAMRDPHESTLTFSNHRNKNLQDFLIQLRTYKPILNLLGSLTTSICKSATCRYCPNSCIGTTHVSVHNVTCKSQNWPNQKTFRLQEHYWNLSKRTEQKGQHFTSSNHEGIKDIQIHILTFIK